MDGPVDRHESGFTLIELMIVVAVLSVLTATVSLGVNRPKTAASSDWARFETVHGQLRAEAVLGRAVLGLAVDAEGYQRMRYAGGGWEAVGPVARWRDPVVVLEPVRRDAPLVFAPGGQGTKLRLRFGEGAQRVVCESDGWVPVTCGRS